MELSEILKDVAPTTLAVLLVAGGLIGADKLFERLERRGKARRFTRQFTLLGLTVAGLVVVVLSLPIDPGEKGNLLSLIGIVLSAAVALSSTTLLGNILAGLMIRSLRRLGAGDFVQTGEQFGRVTELGLLFTEVQAPDSTLWQVPNLFLVQRPLQVFRSQGTIVTAEVSLGYDLPRQRVREALVAAAETAGLEDSFVLVIELGDFSVTYRCGGLLKEVKALVSTNSSLRAAMLDALHEAGLEIVSPTFMSTRALQPDQRILPARERSPAQADTAEEPRLEAIAFEKADTAEVAEALRAQLTRLEAEREKLSERAKAARKEDKQGAQEPSADLEAALDKVDRRIERLQVMIQAQDTDLQKD